MRFALSIILFFTIVFSPAQKEGIADLLFSLRNEQQDTARAWLLSGAGGFYQKTMPDSAIFYHEQAVELYRKLKDDEGLGQALIELGIDHMAKGNIDSAHAYFEQALKIALLHQTENKESFKKIFSAVQGNLGSVFRDKGIYDKALEHYFAALKADEALKNMESVARHYGNIGNVYRYQSAYAKALEYYDKCAELLSAQGNRQSLAIVCANRGMVYFDQGDFTRSLNQYLQAFEVNKEFGRKRGIASNHGNIGGVYTAKGDSALLKGNKDLAMKILYPKAIDFFKQAVEMNIEIGNKTGLATNYGNLGSLYLTLKNYSESEQFLTKALKLSAEINSLDHMKDQEYTLSKLYEETQRPALALKHYKLYIQYSDSVNSEESARKSIQQEFQFNYEKKFAADSVLHAKEKQISEAKIAGQQSELKARQNLQYFLIAGLAMIVLFGAIMYNRYSIAKKQKQIIEVQKKVVEEKQKEILDSIYYARRIQRALITNERYIQRHLSRLIKKSGLSG